MEFIVNIEGALVHGAMAVVGFIGWCLTTPVMALANVLAG